MSIYHYVVIERPEALVLAGDQTEIDMENLDYKRQPDVARVEHLLTGNGALVCGIWRGGVFGLATNQIAVLTAWQDEEGLTAGLTALSDGIDCSLSNQCRLSATVRPAKPEKCTRPGFYVIRWIRMNTADIAEYTALCLETWPAFEAAGTARCSGVFRPLEDHDVSKILMLTWYASLTDWEQTRTLEPADKPKWARRSQMELSHWAECGRLVT